MKLTTDSGAPRRRAGSRQTDINFPARTPDTAEAPKRLAALIDQLTQANVSPAPRDLPTPEPTAAAAAGLTPMQALDLANGYDSKVALRHRGGGQ